MKCIKLTFLVLLVFLSCVSVHAGSDKKLVFSTSDSSTTVLDAYFLFLKMAYKEIGYDVELEKLSDKRSYAYADKGIVDGLVLTSKSLLEIYPNLMVVDIPLTRLELVAYSILHDFKVEKLENFKPYKIGILRGYPLTVQLTENMDRQIVDSYDSLFSILELNRVDIIIILKREAQSFLKANPGFKNIKELHPPIHTLPLYHLLNKKHEDLIPKITPVIKRLLKENVLDELRRPYLKRIP